ncbi:hypothetical protein NDA01_21700 [Trichocoleus desertorum AS-A10]|uniref:hypothetical protein n=1 Tax=Trichocoleus desertorum TaxID=1481672 RepID=UPI0032980E47
MSGAEIKSTKQTLVEIHASLVEKLEDNVKSLPHRDRERLKLYAEITETLARVQKLLEGES